MAGASGTGKTLVARTVLEELSSRGVLTAHVNCTEHSTLYAALEKLIAELRILRSERISTPYKLEQLSRFVGSRPCVVVLDEVDKVLPKERGLLLYHLAGMGRLGVVCISSHRHGVEALSDQVRSRLSATYIDFPPYSSDELQEILRQRVDWGLKAGACGDDVVLDLARGAAGNARVAIQALRRAAVTAAQRSARSIDIRDIGESWDLASLQRHAYLLSLLAEHQRMLLLLLETNGSMASTQLFGAYRTECERVGARPIARRTFTHYMTKLGHMGLVEVRRADGKGNERSFRILPPPGANKPGEPS